MSSEAVGGLSLWVRLAEWEVVDGEVPEPAPGVVLRAAALVLEGRSELLGTDALEGGSPQGVVPVKGAMSADASAVYVITGEVVEAVDICADYGQGLTHVGAELLMQVDDWRLYARVEGRATQFSPHSRFPVRVRGELRLLESYNRDAAGRFRDVRADWAVADVRRLPDRDWQLRVERL